MLEPLRPADERQGLKFGAAVQLPHGLGAEQFDPRFFDRGRAWRADVPEPPYRRQVVGFWVAPVDREQPLHDRGRSAQRVAIFKERHDVETANPFGGSKQTCLARQHAGATPSNCDEADLVLVQRVQAGIGGGPRIKKQAAG